MLSLDFTWRLILRNAASRLEITFIKRVYFDYRSCTATTCLNSLLWCHLAATLSGNIVREMEKENGENGENDLSFHTKKIILSLWSIYTILITSRKNEFHYCWIIRLWILSIGSCLSMWSYSSQWYWSLKPTPGTLHSSAWNSVSHCWSNCILFTNSGNLFQKNFNF